MAVRFALTIIYTMRPFVVALPLVALLSSIPIVAGQLPNAQLQSVGFNSTFQLSSSQIQQAELSQDLAQSVQNVLRYERSQLANGGVGEDIFYTLPASSATKKPGILLKVQEFTPPDSFVIPPGTSLSRFIYTTTNLNGTVVPASAFILWPYTPRKFDASKTNSHNEASNRTVPVVAWAHGTSGFFASAAPSTHRGLWYAHTAPFTLAQAGYAVVAADYAGLGISKSWDGSEIPHQFLASPAGANDVLYSLRAARAAFGSVLSNEFVVAGHSQGGGVAWAVAEALKNKADEFRDVIAGYRGTIAISPTTDLLQAAPRAVFPLISMAVQGIFPSFTLDKWFTALGIKRIELQKETQGGFGLAQYLFFTGDSPLKDGVADTWYAKAYANLANASGRKFQGPLLVIHGTADPIVPYKTVANAFEATKKAFPQGDLQLLTLPDVGHTPAVETSRLIWLEWIEDRFEGKSLAQKGYFNTSVSSFLPINHYPKAGVSFAQWSGSPEYSYQIELGV